MAEVKPKKRGRKPREVYTMDCKSDYRGLPSDEPQENIILHLPIASVDVEDDLVFKEDTEKENEKPVEPIPYCPEDYAGSYTEISSAEKISADEKARTEAAPLIERADKLTEFEDKKSNRLIRTTMTEAADGIENDQILCWWCSHAFENGAIRLPISYKKETFEGYGHFCSYNCACSYLFNSLEYLDKKWDIYSLLNMMYRRANNGDKKKVRLAPPKQDLKIYGGHMTISEFRAANLSNEKEYKLLVPPMTLVIPQIEETKPKYDDNNLIPVNRQKMQNATEALKIRRSKPILDHKHTLNSFMTIKKVTV